MTMTSTIYPSTPLRRALERKGMSQAELARRIGVKRQQVHLWVCGENIPAPLRRVQIAQIVGAPTGDLWPDSQRKAAA